MLHKRVLRRFIFQIGLSFLILNILSVYYPHFMLEIGKVKADQQKPEAIVPYAKVISTLPIPSGRTITSAQAAVYWDGTYLHVWYGCNLGSFSTDDIFYMKTSDFINWETPVKVIDRTDGIRDPTAFVEGDYIYLFCQCYDGFNYRPIRLYKISKTSDFTNSSNYIYVGVPIDTGSSGQFDDVWLASACVVKIGSTYWMAYEAKSSTGIFSIGRAYATNIEGHWTKDGQLRDTENNVIYDPYGQTKDIVPETFTDSDTLFIHIKSTDSIWRERYIKGDFPNNSVTLNSTDCQPSDGYANHCNFAHIGFISNRYYFLMQSWNSTIYLRLYAESEEEPVKEVFAHGFEGGNFGEDPETGYAWTGTSVSSGQTLESQTSIKHHGSYGMHAKCTESIKNAFAYKDISDSDAISFRAYVYFTDYPDALYGFGIMRLRNTGGGSVWRLRFRETGALQLETFYPSFATVSTDTINLTQWYCIEVEFVRDSSVGEYRVYIDGEQKASRTGVNTSGAGTLGKIDFGVITMFSSGVGLQEIYGDCVVAAGTYIGPEPQGDTQAPLYSDAGASTTIAGQPCLFQVLWNDNVNVSGYIFGCNITGQWINDTWTKFTAYYNSTAAWSNITKTLPSTWGVRVEWQVWCNDTNNNWGTTGLQYFTTIENVPTIGEFQAPSIVYANKYFLLNTTINDLDGISDFANATIEISNGVTLGWIASTDTFNEQSDPNGCCTLDSAESFKTQLNSTAYKLSFKIKLDWSYPEGPTSVISTNTKVFNNKGANSSASYANLFYFEDDLVVYSASVDDSRINPSQTITFTGTLYYQNSTTPPEDTYGITAKVELNAALKGSTTTISADGMFSVSFTGESSIAQFSYVVFASTDENTIQNQTVNVIVDGIKITEGGVTKETLILGETATIWFKAAYEYDSSAFTDANGTLYLNGFPMSWSTANERWEYLYEANALGTATFTVSAVYDSSQDLTTVNDMVGNQTITVLSAPFSIISNSTITELSFNSTSKTITFTVTGPDGTIGYANITIEKTLIENITDLTIYFDENQIEYTATSTEYAWLIHFTYTHSTHEVTIQLSPSGDTVVPEFPLNTTATLSVILIALTAIILMTRKRVHGKIS